MEKQQRILLVEDESSHVRLVCEAFSRSESPFELQTTGSLLEARQHLDEGGYGLVLADYLLGDGHGLDLIPTDSDIADYGVVLLTSYGDEHVAVAAMKSGAVDYIVKSPETFQSLPRICERALENRRLLQERREAEQALRRSEQQLRLALQASGSAAWEFDPATGITMWTREAVELTGLKISGQSTSTRDYLQQVHPDDRSAIVAAWQRLLEAQSTPGEPVRVEHRLILDDGNTRWVELCGRVIESNGSPRELAGTLTDITARKLASEEFKQKELELAHVARLATLGELVAGIAHELNQPLTAIKNYAAASDQLFDGLTGDVAQLREWNSNISAASDLAGCIIRRLRSLVESRSGRRTPVDIPDLIQSTRSILLGEEHKLNVKVRFHCATRNTVVEADAIQIQQVLINLLRNAYDAVSENSASQRQVEIRVTSSPDWMKISVTDNGPGLPPEHLDRVFDSFFTTRDNGLGMGLAISRSILEAHNGNIRVSSRPGDGASFEVELPQAGNQLDGDESKITASNAGLARAGTT